MEIKKVTMIPAKKSVETKSLSSIVKKRKVCGYARVSTDKEEQQSSYTAQVDYYTNLIKSNPSWEYVDLYSDEGISGTSMKHRDGFNKMIDDALAGKIDLIITKSVSRFARNTVDTLQTIRKLKEHNVEVFFEKEHIYSLDGKGEVLLSILSSLAQEESRSISLNTTWGHRKRFSDGRHSVAYNSFLGYDKGEEGKLVVNKKQAETIKLIYKMYLLGKSLYGIKQELERLNLETPMHKKVWHISTIKSILTNEKYKGDALLQKQYTVDFLTKKRKTNEGEIPQYYVTDDHEPIIDKKTFDLVQIEREKRNGVSYSGTDVFSNKIVCGECGSQFGKKVWHSNDKYRCVVYRCNKKYCGKKCSTGHVTENEIKEKFVEAYNSLDRNGVIRNVESIKQVLMSSDKEKSEQKKLQDEYDKCEKKLYKLIEENSTHAQNQDEYNKKYRDLADKSTKIQEKLDKITATLKDKSDRAKVLETYINDLKASKNKLTDFDEGLFYALVDRVKVNKDSITIIWKDGTES